jgi:hypothetical protein
MRERWPWQWSMAGLLAVLVFGTHASLRFWLPGLFVRLFGEVPNLAQAPPAMIMLLGGYVGLSFIGGVLIADRVSAGQLARDQARWAHEEEVRWRLWAMERQVREEHMPAAERHRLQESRASDAAITAEARRRLGLPDEEHAS